MSDRTMVYIDGQNTYSAVKALGSTDIDYKKLLGWLDDEFGSIWRVVYYTTVSDDEHSHQDIAKLLDYLQYNGYSVFTKPIRVYDNDDRRTKRGDITIDIAVDIVRNIPYSSNIVLFSGDTNLKRSVQIAQAQGCRVTVISTNTTSPRVVSDELRRIADEYIELADIMPSLAKAGKPAAMLVK